MASNLSRDPSHDVWKTGAQPLDAIFNPQTVALVGATERQGSVGRTILKNLTGSSFRGRVFPVNPKRFEILGIRTFPNLRELPQKADLAVIVTPAPTVPGIIKECVSSGVQGAIIISAGFKELGPSGEALEKKILEEAHSSKMRIIGPNCLGVMNPMTGLNATFASGIAGKGNVAFISQSGALCTAILDWSREARIGFSAFVSIGSMLDVDWGDLIDFLGNDPHTKSILIYMETIGDVRSFMSAAREVALTRPIILLKAGSTGPAAKAAASHTGALAGSDKVHDAAFRRCGVLRVRHISDLFEMAEVLAKQPRPKGPRLAMLTNAGGPAVLATDALIESGGKLAKISPETAKQLNNFLPPHWSHNNPIDILGDAGHKRYAQALDIVINDPENDGSLVILTPQAMTEPVKTAEHLVSYAKGRSKPILASWMGGSDVAQGKAILSKAGIPVFDYPDAAARIFQYMWSYSHNLKGLYETPVLVSHGGGKSRASAHKAAYQIIEQVQKAGRTLLTEYESKALLEIYGVPAVDTRVAKSLSEAVQAAESIGYPVVLKLFSETITHKTDVGGVRLDLKNRRGVEAAYASIEESVRERAGAGHFLGVTVQRMVKRSGYELILGSSTDPQFGPVMLFGAGGKWVEIFKDRSLGLPPLNTTLARRMAERTRIFSALKGARGEQAVDLDMLEELLVRFSRLVVDERRIKEIDINPLLLSGNQAIALDARIILHGTDIRKEDLPRLSIRPYPSEYTSALILKNKTRLIVRPIRPEDEKVMTAFHKTLSEDSVRQRYFEMIKLDERTAHNRLIRRCHSDYDREMALVAEHKDAHEKTSAVVGVGRLSRIRGTDNAELSVLISDRFQGQGLGAELVKKLLQIGKKEKIEQVYAAILFDNIAMRHICKKLAFNMERGHKENLVIARKKL